MTRSQKIIASALAATTMLGAVAGTTGSAEARGFPGGAIAGLIGGAALGAIAAESYAPRRVYVVHRRYVHRHRCGCVVHVVRSYE